MENFPLVLSSSSFKTVAELYYYYYIRRENGPYTQTDRENCWVRRWWWWWGRHIQLLHVQQQRQHHRRPMITDFFRTLNIIGKKKTMQFFRSSRPIQHGSQPQTLVVFIFLYIHSSLIPLLCNNNNNTIKDNKIQINAGRCKYAPIRSSFQPHTPYRIMSKYKKIRVLCLYFWIILNRTVFIWDILRKAAESLYAQKRKNENRTKWR